jgi:hypothetical protein
MSLSGGLRKSASVKLLDVTRVENSGNGGHCSSSIGVSFLTNRTPKRSPPDVCARSISVINRCNDPGRLNYGSDNVNIQAPLISPIHR